jgi:hypothetical protein
LAGSLLLQVNVLVCIPLPLQPQLWMVSLSDGLAISVVSTASTHVPVLSVFLQEYFVIFSPHSPYGSDLSRLIDPAQDPHAPASPQVCVPH